MADQTPQANLITQLADAIVALINAKPQSPTKAEIREILQTHIKFQAEPICERASADRHFDEIVRTWKADGALWKATTDCQGEASVPHPRDRGAMPICRETFIFATGREPQDDDLERCNCSQAGSLMHSCCGWNEEHAKPQFMIGPRVIETLKLPYKDVSPSLLKAIEAVKAMTNPQGQVILGALGHRCIDDRTDSCDICGTPLEQWANVACGRPKP